MLLYKSQIFIQAFLLMPLQQQIAPTHLYPKPNRYMHSLQLVVMIVLRFYNTMHNYPL